LRFVGVVCKFFDRYLKKIDRVIVKILIDSALSGCP